MSDLVHILFALVLQRPLASDQTHGCKHSMMIPGSSSCPQRGCYDCPSYAPGENPHFKERHRRAELARAKDFMASGEADKWRKVAEL